MPASEPPAHKVIISGTGRAGTTFLVELMTELGLDTGISERNRGRKYYPQCSAGLEFDMLREPTPYIVKNPALCDSLPQVLASGRFIIDHAYIPIRELGEAAASRADVGGADGSAPGGLWGTRVAGEQAAVLAAMFHRLVHTLTVHEIPLTFIAFPRMVHDCAYLRGRLEFVARGVGEAAFDEAFRRCARPSMVHTFQPGQPPVLRPQPRGRRRLIDRVLGREGPQ